MKAGKEVVPEEMHRLKAEDIYTPKQNGAQNGAANGFGQKGANGQIHATGASPVLSGGSMSSGSTLDAEFGEDYNPNTGFRDASQTLYAKKGDKKVTLQDFVIRKVIGRGSFGKVFLVEKKDTKEVFAMKSLRKDVILDYDQVESTKLEKEILMQADHPFLVGMHYVF